MTMHLDRKLHWSHYSAQIMSQRVLTLHVYSTITALMQCLRQDLSMCIITMLVSFWDNIPSPFWDKLSDCNVPKPAEYFSCHVPAALSENSG
jgi:hypothetical protein